MSSLAKTKYTQEDKLTIKETDFLLKLMMNSQYAGTDIEVAYSVLMKLSKIHKAKLES